MKKILLTLWLCAIAMLPAQALQAQDITGQWQGTLNGNKDVRLVLKISQEDAGQLSVLLYSIDQGGAGIPVSSLSFQDSLLKFAVGTNVYEGLLSPDGKSIKGIWSQSPSLPLDFARATEQTAWTIPPPLATADASPHTVQFVTVDNNVKLEVLDWGGTGRPLIFLAGLGITAHVFDKIAPKLATKYHVYGITRRGYGASSKPDPAGADYSSDRLGDDVLAVMDALQLDRPVLAGWSMGGEELSSIGSRYPQKIAGLIYLDAGYAYAYYAPGNQVPEGSNLYIDLNTLRAKIDQMIMPGLAPQEAKALVRQMQQTDMARLKADLAATGDALRATPDTALDTPPPAETPQMKTALAILAGEQKYTDIKAPVLAIFAVPHNISPHASGAGRAILQAQEDAVARQVKKFRAGMPSAHIVRLPKADHDVFNSNEADVLRETNAFMDKLP